MSYLDRIPWIGRRRAQLARIDWQRRDVRDGLVIFALALAAYAWAHFGEVAPRLFHFAIDHADYEVDDAIFIVFVMSVALSIFVLRRMQDLGREIKARRAAEDVARTLARHDPLTGLPNRRFFNEKLEDALRTVDDGEQIAVLMLDLDGFKNINDTHGHNLGDQALVEFAERIGRACRGATVARLGGDEFTVVLRAIKSIDEPTAVARRISAAVAEPFAVGGNEFSLSAGIGIAIAPDDGTTADGLLRRADLALYRAKAEGRSCTRFFEPAMDAHVERRSAIESELRAAVASDAIDIHFQPLVNLTGERIMGFEALARWQSSSLGNVAPGVFIGIAEESGLIGRLGEQLLRKACRVAAQWPRDLTLAFNVSPLQLREPSFALRVLAILGETGLAPQQLELEITESAIVGDALLAQRLIDELRSAGVRIALDDFGTGYATMSQLLSFRFDKIKIDCSFVQKLGLDPHSEVIVKAIIGLANGLGLTTTAEGIETRGQLAELKAGGCVEGQGFLFGRAVPASEIPELLRRPPVRNVA